MDRRVVVLLLDEFVGGAVDVDERSPLNITSKNLPPRWRNLSFGRRKFYFTNYPSYLTNLGQGIHKSMVEVRHAADYGEYSGPVF